MKTLIFIKVITLASFIWCLCNVVLAQEKPSNFTSTNEGTIKADEVKPGAVIYRYKALSSITVTGFYTRLANCVGPRQKAVEVVLRSAGELSTERVYIPVYGTPLNMYTRQNGKIFPPLDVAQEY